MYRLPTQQVTWGGTESDRGALLSFLTALMALGIVDIRICEAQRCNDFG